MRNLKLIFISIFITKFAFANPIHRAFEQFDILSGLVRAEKVNFGGTLKSFRGQNMGLEESISAARVGLERISHLSTESALNALKLKFINRHSSTLSRAEDDLFTFLERYKNKHFSQKSMSRFLEDLDTEAFERVITSSLIHHSGDESWQIVGLLWRSEQGVSSALVHLAVNSKFTEEFAELIFISLNRGGNIDLSVVFRETESVLEMRRIEPSGEIMAISTRVSSASFTSYDLAMNGTVDFAQSLLRYLEDIGGGSINNSLKNGDIGSNGIRIIEDGGRHHGLIYFRFSEGDAIAFINGLLKNRKQILQRVSGL